MKLIPLGDKIVIKQAEAESKTKSGIVLPTQSKENRNGHRGGPRREHRRARGRDDGEARG